MDAHHGSQLVREHRTHGGDHLRDGGLAQYGAARRAVALGVLVRDPEEESSTPKGFAVYRPRRRPGADSLVVRKALADGSHLSRGASAPGVRDAKALVGDGDPEDAPALLALFSLVALFAHQRMAQGSGIVRRTAWYDKKHPTFSDAALALVRRELWGQEEATFCGSPRDTDTVKVPRALMERLTDAVCYAA